MARSRVANAADAGPASDSAVRITKEILELLFGPPRERSFAVRLWEGSVEEAAPGTAPRFTLVLKRRGALPGALLPPGERSLGEAYVRGDLDVEGDIEGATALADTVRKRFRSPLTVLRLLTRLLSLAAAGNGPEKDDGRGPTARAPARLRGRRHSPARDASAVRFHYDVGNEFYRLWLDPRMQYSSAYFRTGTEDLASAQEEKLELFCRMLELQPDERLLDVGCGWGGLVRFAARRYGVRATGITLSEAQARFGRTRIEEAGLERRCRIDVRDYRGLESRTRFDKAVSIGMVEHVGLAELGNYFREMHRLLEPGGLFLITGIVDPHRLASRLLDRWSRLLSARASFIERYVFPDGELVAPAVMLRSARRAGFRILQVARRGGDYARTLRHWVRRLEKLKEEAIERVGKRKYRIWRLYMAGSARAFHTGRIDLLQALFRKEEGV